jgi:hypothetical protein
MTCSTTRLVVEQVLQFFGLKPCKTAIIKEVVQKLKFLNNHNNKGDFFQYES